MLMMNRLCRILFDFIKVMKCFDVPLVGTSRWIRDDELFMLLVDR